MKLTYRPEIDGLRAIAVGAVILYHAQITIFGYQPFRGGFIGVDIFFVISGYLITSIILKELVTTGTFSFKHFYERRVRRILPALLFVMLVSLPFAWMYLLPSSFVDFSKSILYSLGFSSNFYFHYSGLEYSVEGLQHPFLHTWSLSVEEQYYILFPIVLLITFKYFRNHLLTILVIGLIISLQIADFASRNYSSANFYFLHTRMWELLAGSILAYFEITLGHRSKNKTLNLILPSVGLFLIGNFIIFFNDRIFHPSFFTLSPIIGVCFIIWFSSKNGLITKILSTKLFVGIGLISYSLYLWHYPIFAFARIIDIFQKGLFVNLLLVIIILVLSIFSYYFIERPARNKNSKFKVVLSLILILISILVALNINIIQKDGYKHRLDFNIKNYELDKKKYLLENTNFEINYNYDEYDDRKNVLIVGNSHAEDILEIFSKTNLVDKVYFNLTSPKIRYDGYNFQLDYMYKFLTEKKAIIDGYNGDFYNHLKKQYDLADLIILSTFYFDNDLNILEDLIKFLKKDNKKIIIFDNALIQKTIASMNRLDYWIYRNQKFPKSNILKKIEEKMFLDLKNKSNINQQIELIAKRNNVFLIKREKIFCDLKKKRCPSMTREGYKIYHDYGHITDKGAEYFARIIEKDVMFLKYLNSTLYISSN